MTNQQHIPFIPGNANDALALDIARAFHDESRMALYREVCGAYDHQLIYKAFRETMQVPSHQVKKSRRAIFFYIIKTYERK